MIWRMIKKNWRKIITAITVVSGIPIGINYLLLSWRAPGLKGEVGDWLGFFANFLGLIGAVLIALYQLNKQKLNEQEKDVENNRSYVDIQDFNATLMLKGVITHENSRIIKTDGYNELLRRFNTKDYGKVRAGYLKIAHYGNPELIFDCSISLDISFTKKKELVNENLKVNIGVIEKNVEIFIPLTPEGSDSGQEIDLQTVTLNYSTIKGEKLQIYRDYINRKETLYSLTNDSEKKIVFKYDMKQIGWVYPNKIDHSILAP
ncbi:hypothetical protein ACI2LM_32820 [Paenibacillus lautus]|uniref:hypothetical protein n=1 Tax=Paenibacillus lautus TaxID=1401 RepID=UPI00384C9CAD